MAAPLDLSNIPQDTCPLCRQRALTFSENTLRCGQCNSVAELDIDTNRVRYITINERYQDLADSLRQNWLSRRQLFELTNRPLPAVVFLPIILALFALCVLLGVVAAVLAIRPSLMTSRELIELAYARTAAAPNETPISGTNPALMSPVAAISATSIITDNTDNTGGKITGTLVAQIETPTPDLVLPTPPTDDPNNSLPPTQAPKPQSPATPTVGGSIFTPTPLPATNTPVPTAATRIVALTPTTLGQTSPLATPTQAASAILTSTPTTPGVATATATATATPNPGATPTPTVSAAPTPTFTVIFSGTFPSGTVGRSILYSNFIQISDVKVLGEKSFSEGDEYIDLLNNNLNAAVNLSLWRIRINGVAVYYIPGNIAANQNFSIPAGQGCRIYTGNVNTQIPTPYNWCGPQNFSVTTSSIGLYTNDHGTIDILDENSKVVASFTY